MYTRDQILQKVGELAQEQPWNHKIELPFGVETVDGQQTSHGKNLVKWARLEECLRSFNLAGKRVLDVGCNEGFFSLKLAQLGVREVVAIDADAARIRKAVFAADVLGVTNVRYDVADIFDKSIEAYGRFDLALCLGFLHRVPYPYEALAQLARISDTILLEWKSLRSGSFDLPIMQYCGGISKDANRYSGLYWLPSVRCVLDMLESLGFSHHRVMDGSKWRRTIVISSRQADPTVEGRDVTDVSKCMLLIRLTRAYLGSVNRVVRDRTTRWFRPSRAI
jgi:tRNA (mo5U34)-methyltransferase